MSLIGTLLVELGMNTASFKDGLDKATYQAQQFSKEVAGKFSELKDSIGEVVTAFAGLDPAISGSLGAIGASVSTLLDSLGSVGGVATGLGAALAAVGIAGIATAAEFSETASRLNDLSHATGIAVETLSKLGQVAATQNVDQETFAKGLERLARASLAAAQQGPAGTNAFRDLGIAVTNSSGQLRSAEDIFDDVADKFSKMPDGPMKTAEAMKIFGRAGANLIPVLDLGRDKIEEMGGEFAALNSVISGPTAAASKELEEQQKLVRAAFTGIENELTADLVPALIVVAKEFTTFFTENQDGIKAFADGIAAVSKVTLNVFQEVGLVFSLLYRAFYTAVDELQVLGGTLGKVLGDVSSGKFGQIWQDVKAGSKAATDEMVTNFDKALESIKSTGAGLVAVQTAALPKADKNSGPQSPANPAPDLTFLTRYVQELQTQAAKEGELANAVGKATEAQIDANTAAQVAATLGQIQAEAVSKGIQNTKAYKDALDAAIPSIQAAAEFEATFKAAISDQGAIDTFNKKIQEQAAMLRGEADAGTAVERQQAKNNAALLPLIDNLSQLGLKYQELRVQYGDADSRVIALAGDFARESAEVQAATEATEKLNAQVKANAGQNEVAQQNAKVKALQETVAALQEYGEANGKVAVAVAEFKSKTDAADATVARFRADLIAENVALQQQAAQKLATPGSSQEAEDLKIQIQYLNTEIGQYKARTDATVGYEQALRQLNSEYQDLQAKTGGFLQGATAAFADFAKSAESSGQIMQKSITQALDGITTNLADAIATGKADWQSLVTSMEEALLKSSLNTIISSLFKSLGNLLGGQGGILGSLGSAFGGGHAMGGDVTPGKTYLVGEQGPELLQVGGAGGSIIPNNQIGGGGGSQNITVVQNISTPSPDAFRKSSAQIHAQAYSQVRGSASRLGR